MKRTFLALLATLLLLPMTSFAQDLPTLCKVGTTATMTVSTHDDLRNALAGAKAGDTILVSGNYSGNYTLEASGTADNPITIKGNNGQAIFQKVFTLAGDYAVITGMTFDNGMVTVTGNHNRVTRNRFINGQKGGNSSELHSAVNLEGTASYNRVDHNFVTDWLRRSIRNTKTRSETWGNRVDHNYLVDLLGDTGNSGEAFQVGTGHHDPVNYPGTVFEYNLVDNFTLEAELVSLKANMNILRYNTFMNAPKAVVASRTGSYNTFQNNTLINVKQFNIYGDHNNLVGNKLDNSDINIRSGDCLVTELYNQSTYYGCHPTARETLVVGNQFVNGGKIRIGQKGTGSKEWPDRNFPVENTTFGLNGNVTIQEEGLGAIGTKYINSWEGDIGTPVTLTPNDVGLTVADRFCQVLPDPTPLPDIASACEVIHNDGTVRGFSATGEEVQLDNTWHNSIQIARSMADNKLSLYEWYGSTSPFHTLEGTSFTVTGQQIKKVVCEAVNVPDPDPTPDPEPEPDPDPTPDPEPEPDPDPAPVRSIVVYINMDTTLSNEEVIEEIYQLDLDITKIVIQEEFKGKGRNK